jgi:hypothetical protein
MKYKELLDEGIITEKEFTKKSNKISMEQYCHYHVPTVWIVSIS